MAGLFSTISNYGGRQPDNVQGIKQFISSGYGTVSWIYKRIQNNISVITPYNQNKAVLIPNNLIVLGSILNHSDDILKENVEPINSTNVLKLNPVSFQFKKDDQYKTHFGFIAQELESIYPELVSDNAIGFKTVNYIELVPILLSQLKSMQTEIDILKEELNIMKNQK